MNKILLVDGNSILNRAFYGLPLLTNKEGIHTNAILGFLNILQKVIDEELPTNICIAFDVKKPTFRHEMYKEYKGTRKLMPDELREQVPIIKEVLKAMNIKTIEIPGFEADDVLGTMSRIGYKEGYKVVVLSGDRDLLQLATDDILIRIPKTKAGKTTVENYYAEDVKNTYGVDPITFIELKALMGDSSDNIPGVPGIGEKTASKLLIEYGSLDALYAEVENMKPSKMKTKLIENKDMAYFSKVLATIKLDVPIDVKIEDTIINEPYNKKTYELFKKLDLKSLLNRFENTETEEVKKIDFKYELISEEEKYKSLLLELNNNAKLIGFDFLIEDQSCVMASLSYDEGNAFIIPFTGFVSVENFTDDLLKLAKNGIKLTTISVKQNLCVLEQSEYYSLAKKMMMDCGIAAYLLNPLSLNYEYAELAELYAGLTLKNKKELIGKKNINMFSYTDEDILKYMGYCSNIPRLIWKRLEKELIEKQMYDLYKDIELPCLYSLYTMEKNGIRVDREGLLSYGEKLKTRISEITQKIYGYVGKEFNINSTKQLGSILFEEMGLKAGKKTKTGYSTSVDVLEKIANQHPIIPLILEYRQLTKLDSTYVEGLSSCISVDGRIHGTFNQTVTATGRISSTEPNLQNIPTRYELGREVRRVFIPEDGYVFLDADYSQIELRVLAHMSGDETLIKAYNQGTDIHSITASQAFGVPLEEVTDTMRRKAKAVNFGIVYGISSFGLGQDLDISRKEAEGYIEKYFDTYKRVKEYLDECIKKAKDNGYSITMFGRKRPIPELKSSNFMTRSFGERVAMNSPIQGTAADIMKIAMVNVDNALKGNKLKSRLVLQVHDELIIEAYKPELEEVKDILVNEMINAAKLQVPLMVDVHSGANWLEAK